MAERSSENEAALKRGARKFCGDVKRHSAHWWGFGNTEAHWCAPCPRCTAARQDSPLRNLTHTCGIKVSVLVEEVACPTDPPASTPGVCDCGSWDGGHPGDCAVFLHPHADAQAAQQLIQSMNEEADRG